MPFVPQIRKQIFQALDQYIVPALQKDAVLQVWVEPPFHFPHIRSWGVDAPYLEDQTPDLVQRAWRWESQKMNAGRTPFLIFVYRGVVDRTIGITEAMAREITDAGHTPPSGKLVMQLPAPASMYQQPNIPGQDGSEPFHGTLQQSSPACMLCLNLWSHEILAHISESSAEGILCSHSLQFCDPTLVRMAHFYAEELKVAPTQPNPAAQAQLFVLMNRMKRLLQTTSIPLSNTSWPSLANRYVEGKSTTEQLCLQGMNYIETHLSADLNWKTIAASLQVSPAYLNQAFRKTLETTVMRYVTERRIDAAKLMLTETKESLKDISQLVGFASSSSFCAIFKRSTGITPNEFRRQKDKTVHLE